MPRRKKADQRADARGGAWAGIPHCVLDSSAYRHLSLCGRSVLIEIVRGFNGYNNGEIAISQRQLAERLSTSNFGRISRAIAELMKHGFIDVAVEGQWKQRLARQYRLTFVSTGRAGHYQAATNDYRNWRPDQESGAEPVSAPSAISAEPASTGILNAAEPASAASSGKPSKGRLGSAEPASSLISKPYAADRTLRPNIAPAPPDEPLDIHEMNRRWIAASARMFRSRDAGDG